MEVIINFHFHFNKKKLSLIKLTTTILLFILYVCMYINIVLIYLLCTRKMVPLQDELAHFLYSWSFQTQNREGRGGGGGCRTTADQSIKPKFITFSTNYKYTT